MNITSKQLLNMLELQETVNTLIDPEWKTKKQPFMLAALVEGAEAIEHHGYKWWKGQTKDIPQLQMELVDIWHFYLAHILILNNCDSKLALEYLLENSKKNPNNIMFDETIYNAEQMTSLEKLTLFVGLSAAKRIEVSLFNVIMDDCGLTWENLYTQYVSKNTLNVLRQHYGYKEKTYVKIWDGREDNIHLIEIMETLDITDNEFSTKLYQELENRYAELNQ